MSDSELDDVESSKAPLIEHLIELRSRLMKTVIAVFIAFLVCFFFASDIFNILIIPYEQAVGSGRQVEMIFTAPQEYFFTQLKLALFGALFIAFPVIASQIYMFMAPGLYRHERQAFVPFLIATPILFAIGASLVFFVVMPLAMDFFLSMEQTGEGVAQIIHLPKVSEYLGLIMTLIFAFGLVFQLPVVLTLLARASLVNSEGLKTKRKYAVVATFVMAAVLTPPDPISQLGLAIPTLLLYEISILSVKRVEKMRRERDQEREAAD
ncbi:sec-independent protein translocase protein TatC [Cohaesibacter sp. ES.047]|uniref:twin-arginine translocase subunit TatC n=1 Tax=Cohaesibacter sp. ES.047 TaxID=1798205 RepID=UPI000BB70955|nr:twin-arginine translocase subunit TatC [Cohaesibacter sp. ES.047]SNY93644.1 sec-independent protein translocase protein TatC [Cohaesibacter sp. ES.047]